VENNGLKHIAVAGNIGVGKTTLVEILAETYGWKAEFESVEDNPYLSDFYQDMKKWAFQLQVYFLNTRLSQIKKAREAQLTVIQDRTIYEDAFIFSKILCSSGFLSRRDYDTYLNLFDSIQEMIPPPDLIIYLQSEVSQSLHNIKKRGRLIEKDISPTYLQSLHDSYEEWASRYNAGRLLTLNVNGLDFAHNAAHRTYVLSQIDATLRKASLIV